MFALARCPVAATQARPQARRVAPMARRVAVRAEEKDSSAEFEALVSDLSAKWDK